MAENHYLYILVAASAVGKSELLNQIKKENLWRSVPKYSTRDNRGESDDVVRIKDSVVNDVEKEGNLQQIRRERMEYIKRICGDDKGVVYYKNNNIYGVSIIDILEGLEHSNMVVIISDFHVIRLLNENPKLEKRIKVLYIASTVDERELLKRYKSRENTSFNEKSVETIKTIQSIENMCSVLSSAARLKYLTKIEEVLPLLNEQWNSYVPYFDTIKTRSLNIRMLYNRYIDNISAVDYAILNFYDLNYMFQQVRNIINKPLGTSDYIRTPIFFVCAALSSGKATLMEIIGDLGAVNNDIVVTPKYAKRATRATDGRDGMIAIGEDSNFNTYIHNPNDVWCWKFHNGATEYAVDHQTIRNNIEKGTAQIFISNMSQIAIAKKLYPNNIVVLYLHATHETATLQHIQEKRKFEILTEIRNMFLSQNREISDAEILHYFNNKVDMQLKYRQKIENDLKEIKEVHDDFLVHNNEINHVLLNTGTREDLVEQMINLINYYKRS